MLIILVGLLLLGAVNSANGEPKVFFNSTEFTIHMNDVTFIPFTIEDLSQEDIINIDVKNSDENVVTVRAPSFDPSLVNNGIYHNTINVTGVFLGSAKVLMSVELNGVRVII